MIIDEFKSDSTLIRFDDRDIGTKENNEDIKLLKYTSLPFIKMKVAQ